MAKEKKADKADTKGSKDKADDKAEATKEREFKYGVSDLAELLDLEAASVRVKLRNNDIPKAGKAYGWNNKKDLEEVAAKLKADKPKKEKAEKKPKKGDEPAAEEGKKKDKKKDKKKKDKNKD